MNLRDLRQLLTTSDASDWSKLDSSGPLYKNGFVVSGGFDADADHDVNVTWHHSSAVYRDDVDLTIQWGLDLDPTRGRDDQWHFSWAEKLMNSRVSPYWVDVFWRGVLVDRYALASIDGAHGLIPIPHTAGEEPDWYDVVSKRELAVAQLIDDLYGGFHNVDGYIQRLGIRVAGDEDYL